MALDLQPDRRRRRMEPMTLSTPPSVEREALALRQVEAEIRKVIVGQDYLIERLLIGLLARGHMLIEGVPGLAKTLAVKTLARTLAIDFKRIQFTPDLLPADLVGTLIFDPKRGEFEPRTRPGLHQRPARRRDQPRTRQGAVRAARGDGGAAGDAGRHHLPAARALPGARDPEPDRAGGHLPARRGPGRPLPDEAAPALPVPRRGAGDPRAHAGRARDRRPPGARPRTPGRAARRPATASTSTPSCAATCSIWSWPRATPRPPA